MTAFTDSLGFRKGGKALDAMAMNRDSVQVIRLDFAAIAAARTAAGVAALGAADTLEILPVKAGTWVNLVAYNLKTAEGATATMDIGDAASATGFISNLDLNGTPGWTEVTLALTEGTPNTITGYSDGKFYNADGAVRVTLDHAAINVAVIDLVFLLRDYTYAEA